MTLRASVKHLYKRKQMWDLKKAKAEVEAAMLDAEMYNYKTAEASASASSEYKTDFQIDQLRLSAT